jgi:molecular chaperone GrpE
VTTSRREPGRPARFAEERGGPAAPGRTELEERISELEGRISQLATELAESEDRRLRLAADVDNVRKRARQERLDVIQHASQGLIEALLPVLDDLHRALDHVPESSDDSWHKGLELSVQKLDDVLAAQGVQGIDAVGEPFDPNLHEAVASVDSDAPEDTVVQELRRGYRLHDRVLRPSLVKVARRPAEI